MIFTFTFAGMGDGRNAGLFGTAVATMGKLGIRTLSLLSPLTCI